jgi:spore photoproduct lyase
MFSSANLVAFVNTQDLIKAAETELGNEAPAYLCISYDTDLLAIEELFGYCKGYIDYARRAPNVTVEIRTKSANIKPLKIAHPPSNVIIAWTLSPDYVTDRYEHGTPRLKARLKAIADALALGWSVRLCIDPILKVSNWRLHYSDLVKVIFEELDGKELYDISLGVFRIASGYLRAMREASASNVLAHYPYVVSNQSASYSNNERLEMLEHLTNELSKYLPKEKICPVPWQL